MCRWNGTRGCCNRQLLEERYLYTLRHSLTGALLATAGKNLGWNPSARLDGRGWPRFGLTMAGVRRMELLHDLLHEAYRGKGLEGDFLEAGVWRGGSCVYARGFLEAYGLRRNVWVVDSFAGLPASSHWRDAGHDWQSETFLSVPLREVQDGFRRYALMDDSVRFVAGWFGESLPILRSRLGRLAILRVDCDMYTSTLEVLCNLFDSLELGGYCIIDDWSVSSAREAVIGFFRAAGSTDEPLLARDGRAAWLEKRSVAQTNKAWCQSELAAMRLA